MSRIGVSQAAWKNVLWPKTSGDCGATHAGMYWAMPNSRAALDWMKNWFHNKPEPVTRDAPAM